MKTIDSGFPVYPLPNGPTSFPFVSIFTTPVGVLNVVTYRLPVTSNAIPVLETCPVFIVPRNVPSDLKTPTKPFPKDAKSWPSWYGPVKIGVTIRLVEPTTPACVAIIVTGPPAFAAVARPVVLTVAIVASDEVHVAVFVRSRCVMSLKVPVAVS